MNEIYTANWLMPSFEEKESAAEFFREFSTNKPVKKAVLEVSALGVYAARINGEKISYILAPGWTPYHKRVQFQAYDVTEYIRDNTPNGCRRCP